ncbi:MAG: HAD family hydrolase [Pirellulaceae bacterium]|jgi:putative hydrolase of the HAD superfamily|nr:HAD family hydrolase [Pirellulaceae bacterium]
MLTPVAAVIRAHAEPLAPLPAGMAPRLRPLRDVRAVLFDIYGTLFISGSGDLGTTAQDCRAEAMTRALASVGVPLRDAAEGRAAADCLLARIAGDRAARQQAGIDYPEVDLVDVWRTTLGELATRGSLAGDPAQVDVPRLAVEYEVRVNPLWPMPGAQGTLADLRARGVPLGLVSNAQFFTLELFPALWGAPCGACGVDPALVFLSYQHGWAKPSAYLFRRAAEVLGRRGIPTRNVLYIGNDLLNDIWPATQVGFATALFAGDARSLRTRAGDPRVAGLVPDIVMTDLHQLRTCLDGVETQPNG